MGVGVGELESKGQGSWEGGVRGVGRVGSGELGLGQESWGPRL